MHKVKNIRDNTAAFDYAMQKRGADYCAQDILALDSQLKELTAKIQQLQAMRNSLAKENAHLDKASKEYAEVVKKGQQLKQNSSELTERHLQVEKDLQLKLLNIPNLLDDDIPNGLNEDDNQVIREVGEKKIFDFKPKSHLEIGEELEMLDVKSSARISGSRFVFLSHSLARLERALANFMLDMHVNEYGYLEIVPPALVSDETMLKVGQLPKFSADSFQTTDGYRLIPTAEVPLVALVSEQIVPEEKLPMRFTAYSPCFRSEAGSAGRDTKGIFRLHQFSKVELISIVIPEESAQELERTVTIAEKLLQRLKIPYRVSLLCGGDTGFCARKTYDVEVWLPAEKRYREISSCSNCGDFQSIRMNSRYKSLLDGKNYHPHTLNGSALAIGRTMIAIIENYQNADGSITIPEILRPYMNNQEIIKKDV
jgi:seryl-tRNA synthetase